MQRPQRSSSALAALLVLVLFSGCSEVLDRRLAEQAFVDESPSSLVRLPRLFEEHLYLLGGRILAVRETGTGCRVDAEYWPVNRRGFIRGTAVPGERYRVDVPAGRGLPDALRFVPGQFMSLVGRYRGPVRGSAGARIVPEFQAEDVHLWGKSYTKAFSPPPGIRTETAPAEPMPYWQDPLVP